MKRESKHRRFADLVNRIDTLAGPGTETRWKDVANLTESLLTLERYLHRQAEDSCNLDLSEAEQDRRDKRAERRLTLATLEVNGILGLSNGNGVRLYHQTDPRGCALYLVAPHHIRDGQTLESSYSNGVAVCI